MTDDDILVIAHRKCSRYRHVDEFKYRFTDKHMVDFARAIITETTKEGDVYAEEKKSGW